MSHHCNMLPFNELQIVSCRERKIALLEIIPFPTYLVYFQYDSKQKNNGISIAIALA